MEGARLFTTPVWPGTPYTAACTRVLGTPRALGLKIPFSLFMPPWEMESSLPVLNRKPYTAGLRDSLRLNSGSKGTGALVHAFLVLKPLELPGNTGKEGRKFSGRPLADPENLTLGNQRKGGQHLAPPPRGSHHLPPEK